ncbi:hypothetical protein NSQ91_12910 [Paenibacillus sp. FSL R7-0048]|uniref:hypothetical protein n=1 Tax=Paenibacillus TaxID=44249 RepID=UPI00096FC8CF|nr:hypothetical protein [Paenibacillus odorifer]OMD71988.1 hypothetical protein BSK48_09125 [Paenibacillus odorifer]OMD78710.1 hypothetical protein BSK50_07770 [Paenibacillus odorifer]
MQYIARLSLHWFLRIVLILGMMFSFPPAWSGGLFTTEQESTTSEIERYERKFTPPVRIAPQITPQVGAIKITEQWGAKSLAVIAILPVLSLLFRPVIYKFLLRLRLYLLKFTSHFLISLH